MPDDPHDEKDGCLCDCDHSQHEATEDHELPPAKGGIEGDLRPRRQKRSKTSVPEDC